MVKVSYIETSFTIDSNYYIHLSMLWAVLPLSTGTIHYIFVFFSISDANPVGRGHCATSANRTLAVCMERARNPGNAFATKAGVACSVIRIWIFVPITNRARMVAPVSTLVKDLTHANVLQVSLERIVKFALVIVQQHPVLTVVCATTKNMDIDVSAQKGGLEHTAREKRWRVQKNRACMGPVRIRI